VRTPGHFGDYVGVCVNTEMRKEGTRR